MKKLFFTMMLAIVSSVWVMSEAQCLVPSTEQEGPFVEELTGLLCLDAYPCPYEENCPTCLTMVLRTKEKKYYLTGSVMESIDAPTDRQYVKVVVSGTTGSTELGNNEYYNWLKVGKLRYSEEPVTTNIQTHGYVEDESGTRLEGIRVIVHTADRTVSDTVYTHEGGEFVSTIKGIVYPVDSMYVTVSDVSERFKEQRKSTTYTYECGVEFNPETDTGFNSQELLFVLQEKDKSASLPSLCDEWHMLSEPFECGLPACDLKTTIFQAATDTIINHVFYRKLEYTDESPLFGTRVIYKGALREGDNADIYYIPANSEHEYLMYAFNAHVGDTLENLWIGGVPEECPNGYVGVVTGISDGEQPEYTILGVENERGEITWGREWVKGVGFKDNPTGPLFYLNAAIDYGVETILCAYKDGQQVYASSKSEKFGCTYNGLEPTKPYFLCDEWNVLEVKNESGDEVYETHKVRLAGDTILTLPGGDFPRGVKVEQDGQYVGTMRTGNKHDVYYIPAGSTHEYLLYNFDAKVGGSLSNLWCGGRWEEYPNGLSGIIKEISDSNPRVFTIELEYYLPYGFTDGTFPYTIYWIDGVGMPNGPISQECPYFCEQQQVLCAYKNGEQIYTSELGEKYGCSYTKTPSSERWCMPNNRASEGKTIRVGGTLKEVSAPCISDSEEEPCLPCLTIALKSHLKTYYVVSDDAEVLAILDTVSEGLPAIAEGIAFTNGSYSYLQVSKIKPVIVSEFQQRLIGNWQVYKTTITGSYQDENREYSDGETMDFQDTWWNIDATTIDMQGPAVDNWGERLTYTLREQADGTWQIIVYTYYIDYQQGTNEIILYTIHQLTTDRMEWESTSVNSDGTSTTFHEYLWRLPHTEEEPQYFPKGMQWTLNRWQEEKGIVSHSISSCIVQGDTVINDKTYRNIVDGDFIAPIRQEGKKIYVHLNDKDFLLYDFGLEVGDSIPAYGGYGYDPNNELPEIEVDRVVRIDSVTLLDGRKAKVFFYEYRSPDIEYVGDEEFGVLNPIFGEQACTCLDRGQSMCCSLNGKPIYGACGNLHENDVDTIPLYIKDGPGTSTVEPVDPNQIVATLVGDMLSIYEYIGAEIGYKVSKASPGNNMPARGKEMADDTFSESVSIQLKERGLYTLELTNPEWGYTIVGTFEYDGMQGIEPVETGVPAAQKILRNGQLLIQKGDRTYTVQGIELHE